MSSPRIGVVRKSMLYNPRIVKPPMGQNRIVPGLPAPDFTYGIPSVHSDGGMAGALSGWKDSEGPKHQTSEVPKLNFVALNRNAVGSGLITSKELSQLRAQMGGASAGSLKRSKARKPQLPDITFGLKSSESTPLHDVISYEYSRRWKEEQLNRVYSPPKRKGTARGAGNRTTMLRSLRTLPVEQKRFTLSQFKQVPAALNTFRNPEDRPQELSTQQLSGRGCHGVDEDTQAFPQDSVTLTSDL